MTEELKEERQRIIDLLLKYNLRGEDEDEDIVSWFNVSFIKPEDDGFDQDVYDLHHAIKHSNDFLDTWVSSDSGEIDIPIKDLVEEINQDSRFETLYSCSGHIDYIGYNKKTGKLKVSFFIPGTYIFTKIADTNTNSLNYEAIKSPTDQITNYLDIMSTPSVSIELYNGMGSREMCTTIRIGSLSSFGNVMIEGEYEKVVEQIPYYMNQFIINVRKLLNL